MKRIIWVVAAVPLAACAPKLTSTLPAEPATRTSLVGEAVPALPAAAVEDAMVRLQAALRPVLRDAAFGRDADGALRARSDADDTFEAATAQIEAGALTAYAGVADAARAGESLVLHVLVYGDATGADVAASLSARRAASLADYLLRRGLSPARLRAEGRNGGPDRHTVELVFKPVVPGREPQAWVPPAD